MNEQESRKEVSKAEQQELQRPSTASAVSPFEEMDRWFEHFFPHGWLRPLRGEWPSWGGLASPFEGRIPKVDVVDRDDDVLVRAALPGIDKKDLDISMTDSSVTIRARTHHEEKDQKGEYYRHEISSGSFSRTITLPSEVDSAKAHSNFKDGVLELTAPKVARSQRRQIDVS